MPICAQYIRPYSDNTYWWQNVCEFTADPSSLVADQVEMWDSGFPCNPGRVGTCCSAFTGCANLIGCLGPETALPPYDFSESPSSEWAVDIPCAVDNPARIFANVIARVGPDTTTSTCTSYCQEQGFPYAGVEYGQECYCGTGYVDNTPPPADDTSTCSFPCAGSYYDRCGGSWRIQTYKFI
ncbi:hypothetical protein PHLGIDRAFT_246660 [Phlebiopsis gigantea 11061_1 CR5-6]|uniref:WSC domain-containing protein n=1 Tax=Phlebiopsis gigantea (strain 11061_1 CR5-6) TaxID=745531 RepID=A0A0C3PDC9_PHLG1|nr:hypothetical protein PHLGIDRAFT_246660 [Phlebiopsis gigantea 11061_1 CR5-6]